MPVFSQDDRPITVHSPLGDSEFAVTDLRITEQVSGGFEMVLELVSESANINADDLLRKFMSLAIEIDDMGYVERFYHGLVRRFTQRDRQKGLTRYTAVVVPASWFLSLTTHCRVYQGKTVPEIVTSILDAAGITDYKKSLTKSYTAREYCVQYRESDLAFISRLLEDEGIFYFFEHEAGKHTLVLGDSASAVKPGLVPVLSVTALRTSGIPDYLTDFTLENRVCSGKVTLVDYNDTMPRRLETNVTGTVHSSAATNLRIYDYPGKFSAVDAGQSISRVRIEEIEAQGHVVTATSPSRALGAGQKITVMEHYRDDLNTSYQLLSVQTVAHQPLLADDRDYPFFFTTSIVAIPADVPYRPPRVTPPAVVRGTQTAVVVGPSGEEIYVDQYGRVKVQFYWDELGANDENSSCWVRVSNAWAGKNWGFIQIPRIGQEVIVDFLEGDPDRPIVTGRVYNGEMMPPYGLPDNGTQSGVKSRSSKGGGPEEANEFRFEDKKGSEEVYFHAQKDLNSIVLNDETRDVQHDRTTTIKNDETKTVTEGNEATTISQGNRTFDITQGNETITISQGNQEITLGHGDQTLTIDKGKQTVSIDKDQAITIKSGNHALTVKQGNIAVKASLGKIEVEAMQSIELKVGQNSIKIDQTGVTIAGMKVAVEGQIQTEIKAPMTQVNGDGMLVLKGGITMIN